MSRPGKAGKTKQAAAAAGEMAFWSDRQRKGANGGTAKVRPEWFRAAGELGFEFVRFRPNSLPAAGKDFLIGDADRFRDIERRDLDTLRRALDLSAQNGVRVVLAMFSLPGCRSKQQNGDRDDDRLWKDPAFRPQALAFWNALAQQLKGHPAIVAYNPLNEPHPERFFGIEPGDPQKFRAWYRTAQGTPADLNAFNQEMVAAIRAADSQTPLLLDGWFYADPEGLAHLEPIADPKVLYAFHNPGPWNFCAFRANQGRYAYLERMPAPGSGQAATKTSRWRVADLERLVRPVGAFASKHRLPAHRIVASEFWCDRRVAGAKEYMTDLIRLYNRRGWHWAFYEFRSDGDWSGLDYEMGTGGGAGYGDKYAQAMARGEDGEPYKPRRDNPLFDVLRREFRPRRRG